LSSETSAFILQTPGKFPKEHRLHYKHGESLKTTNDDCVFWNMEPCSLIDRYQCFRDMFCLNFQYVRSRRSTMKMEAICSSETAVPDYQTT